ncbi:hypothetical protein L6452_25968 [Arctium lappa]|uniref:Uncharacterized protein n=1 Tax=Arctium lappa TaxID=4217 RepID=A0ACB9AC69_ARCLA|nr:hypothetical protein L6452_44763 [Arctium lappa]KAI3707443.1 hypothetical protein L6452_25968 [Arctium lappa]
MSKLSRSPDRLSQTNHKTLNRSICGGGEARRRPRRQRLWWSCAVVNGTEREGTGIERNGCGREPGLGKRGSRWSEMRMWQGIERSGSQFRGCEAVVVDDITEGLFVGGRVVGGRRLL